MAACGRRRLASIFSTLHPSVLRQPRHISPNPLAPIHRFCSSSDTLSDWTRPTRVGNFYSLVVKELQQRDLDLVFGRDPVSGNKKHWFVGMDISGHEFLTQKSLFDFYVKTLAAVLGSEDKARKQIYLVSFESYFGFGAEIDEGTKSRLEVQPGVAVVIEDCGYDARNKDPAIRPIAQFTPIYRHHRLNDIFSYHYHSERNPEWAFDHWLVVLKQPDAEFSNEQEIFDFCIQVLTKVFRSEEKAKEKIYIVWCKLPFGFAAEVDKKTKNKLKAMSDVLTALPDYAFDVKNKDRGVLVIPPSSDVEFNVRRYCYRDVTKLLRDDATDRNVSRDTEVVKSNVESYCGNFDSKASEDSEDIAEELIGGDFDSKASEESEDVTEELIDA